MNGPPYKLPLKVEGGERFTDFMITAADQELVLSSPDATREDLEWLCERVNMTEHFSDEDRAMVWGMKKYDVLLGMVTDHLSKFVKGVTKKDVNAAVARIILDKGD